MREAIYDAHRRLSHSRLLIQGRKVAEQAFQYDQAGWLNLYQVRNLTKYPFLQETSCLFRTLKAG